MNECDNITHAGEEKPGQDRQGEAVVLRGDPAAAIALAEGSSAWIRVILNLAAGLAQQPREEEWWPVVA
ncbi:MAG: hypothetical protein AB1609_16310 [Bacillota bacterium]